MYHDDFNHSRVMVTIPANQEAFHHQLLEDTEGENVCCLAVPSNLDVKLLLQNIS